MLALETEPPGNQMKKNAVKYTEINHTAIPYKKGLRFLLAIYYKIKKSVIKLLPTGKPSLVICNSSYYFLSGFEIVKGSFVNFADGFT